MSFHLETLLSTEATWDSLNGLAEAEMKPISSLHCSCIKCSVQLSFFGLIDSVNFNIFIFFVNFLVTLLLRANWLLFPSDFFLFRRTAWNCVLERMHFCFSTTLFHVVFNLYLQWEEAVCKKQFILAIVSPTIDRISENAFPMK